MKINVLKGWRTILFNLIMMVAVAVGVNWSPDQVTAYIDAIALIWGGGNAILRAVTNTPLGKSE